MKAIFGTEADRKMCIDALEFLRDNGKPAADNWAGFEYVSLMHGDRHLVRLTPEKCKQGTTLVDRSSPKSAS